jgi:hypothetical protein
MLTWSEFETRINVALDETEGAPSTEPSADIVMVYWAPDWMTS